MQSRGRRAVAVLVALLLAIDLASVTLATSSASASTPTTHRDHSAQQHARVRAIGGARVHVLVTQRAVARASGRAGVTVHAVVRRAGHGKPAKWAKAHAVSHATAAAYGNGRARATAKSEAVGFGPTLKIARKHARAHAREHARAWALVKAHRTALARARVRARENARTNARRAAHRRAVLKAWAKLPGHPRPFRARATATLTLTVVRSARHTWHARATAKASAVARPGRKGLPVGRATQRGYARAKSTARAVQRATATASGRAVANAPTLTLARARAHARARARARAHARKLAGPRAHARAVRRATWKSMLWARGKARNLARARARHNAAWRARLDRIRPGDPRTWIRTRPKNSTPRIGPMFNNPYGHKATKRTLLTHVIRAINSSPGYLLTRDPKTHRRLQCPTDPRDAPSEIKIAVYSIYDKRFARAIVAAHRRCVSVQVLMNSHLSAATSHSWGLIWRTLGPRHQRWWTQYSFARRCHNGCLGTAVLHTKMYLFSQSGSARDVVMTGSSNMTRNAANVQWNDLFTVNNDSRLYGQYRYMFRRMVPGRVAAGPWVFRTGRYTSVFYPFRRATSRSDWTMKDLRSISCRGAAGGAGIRGRTIIYIAMHAWFSSRGRYLAREVRHLYNEGCYVRVLYSFMGYGEYRMLKAHSGARMRVRRVLFAGPLGRATKYSHMKMVAVSGVVAGDRRARVVWTGSNNWSLKSLHADEVTLEIKSALVYRIYVKHWELMERLRSSPNYANFSEPEGGGRAP